MAGETQILPTNFTTTPTAKPDGDFFRFNNPATAETSANDFLFSPTGFRERTIFDGGDVFKTRLNAQVDRAEIPRMDAASEARLSKIDPQMADSVRLMAADLKRQGIDVVAAPKGGLRTVAEQNELYKIGRRGIEGEKPVTWVKGGDSFHNYGLAVDIVPLDGKGNATWEASAKTWQAIGEAGERQGLQWGGRWTPSKRDLPHFQMTGGARTASDWRATLDKGGLQAVWNAVNKHYSPVNGQNTTTNPQDNPTASSSPVPTAHLARHSRGESVKQLQDALFKLGYAELDPAKIGRGHGKFGPITEQCLRDFQSKHNLLVDGIYGPKTQAALRRALGQTEKPANNSTASTRGNSQTTRRNGDDNARRTSRTTRTANNSRATNNANNLPTTVDEANKFFKTQFYSPKWNPTGHRGSNDCGPASLEAALEAVGVHPITHGQASIDAARHLMRAGTYHDISGRTQVQAGAKRAGASVEVHSGWDALDRALASGKAVVAGGKHYGTYRGAFNSYHAKGPGAGHFIAVVGRTNDGKYIVVDSMNGGGAAALSKSQLADFFRDKPNGAPTNLVIVGNPSRAH